MAEFNTCRLAHSPEVCWQASFSASGRCCGTFQDQNWWGIALYSVRTLVYNLQVVWAWSTQPIQSNCLVIQICTHCHMSWCRVCIGPLGLSYARNKKGDCQWPHVMREAETVWNLVQCARCWEAHWWGMGFFLCSLQLEGMSTPWGSWICWSWSCRERTRMPSSTDGDIQTSTLSLRTYVLLGFARFLILRAIPGVH